MNENLLKVVNGVQIFEISGAIYAKQPDEERRAVTFDAHENEQSIPLTRENISRMGLYADENGKGYLPSDFFAGSVHYDDWYNEDETTREQIGDFLFEYFKSEIEAMDRDAIEYWKQFTLDHVQDDYFRYCEDHSDELEGMTDAEKKEAFCDWYMDGGLPEAVISREEYLKKLND